MKSNLPEVAGNYAGYASAAENHPRWDQIDGALKSDILRALYAMTMIDFPARMKEAGWREGTDDTPLRVTTAQTMTVELLDEQYQKGRADRRQAEADLPMALQIVHQAIAAPLLSAE